MNCILLSVLIFFFLLTGTFGTLFIKLQNESYVKNSSKVPRNFDHPLFQLLFTFIALTLLFLKQSKLPLSYKSPNKLIIFFPSLGSLIGHGMKLVGLKYTFASLYLMLMSLTLLFNEIFSIIFLKKKLQFSKCFAILLITIGCVIVGLSAFESSYDNPNYNHFVGIICFVIGDIGFAVQYTFEEYILKRKKSKIDVDVVIKYEGLFGLGIISFVAIFVDIFGNDFDDMSGTFYECCSAPVVFLYIIGYMFCLDSYWITGVLISKYQSSGSRASVDCVRTVTVWVIQIFRGRDFFSFERLVGFAFIVFGITIYFEMIELLIKKLLLSIYSAQKVDKKEMIVNKS